MPRQTPAAGCDGRWWVMGLDPRAGLAPQAAQPPALAEPATEALAVKLTLTEALASTEAPYPVVLRARDTLQPDRAGHFPPSTVREEIDPGLEGIPPQMPQPRSLFSPPK